MKARHLLPIAVVIVAVLAAGWWWLATRLGAEHRARTAGARG